MLMMELKGIHPFRITEVRRGKSFDENFEIESNFI
jgi:hypothetical protein